VLGLLVLTWCVRAADPGLLNAVRADDTRGVAALLRAGADPNTRDDIGATALMHAAAFASLDCLRTLLEAGADPRAVSYGGATALMWATGDPGKVRLLLDRGASADTRLTDGTTALVAAARRGNVDVMGLLLARRPIPASARPERSELLRIAYGDHPEIIPILAEGGLHLGELALSGPPALSAYPVSRTSAIGGLLDLGANPNPRGRFPMLSAAAFQGQLATARLLVDRGADLNAKGQHDVTPLMMAAAATHPDPAIVHLLLERGANPDVRDQAGRTALDWALTQGNTPVARALRDAGATSTPPREPPASVVEPRTARAAVTEAIARLRPISPVLYETRKCVACHHQMLPLWAAKAASTRGFAVDPEAVAHPVRSINAVWNGRREDLMLGREVAGGANELTYGLVAFAEADVPPNSATDAAVANLISDQRTDGSWVFLDTRPPQADNSRIPFTAMAIRGLDAYAPPGLRRIAKTSMARALEFLRAAPPLSTQDEAFKVLGLVWSRVPSDEIAAQAKRLLGLQRASGGWAQELTMEPDAYATGQALYALHASGVAVTNTVYQKGVAYLLRTQLADGTWFVRSRAFGFQPYFESGFPHGSDQFISASATAWAVLALVGDL
jgi:ankyrin repeat protein